MRDYLDQLMQTVVTYLPNVAAATAILLGGWLVARLLAAVVRGGLNRTSLDNRLAAWMGGDEETQLPVEVIISRAIFYLVMLFVLVAFFQALSLDLITEPLNALLTEVTAFAPRLLGALGLLLLAWVLATAARRVVAAALSATDIDSRLGQEATDDGSAVPIGLMLAEAVYWLVLLLFLPAVLGALAIEGLLAPVQNLTNQVLTFLPQLLAAGLILAVGWLVARLVQRIVTNLLAAAGADDLLQRLDVSGMDKVRLSQLAGLVLYVLILVPVVISSLNALQLDAITEPATAMLASILDAVPGLFAAALLLGIAYAVASFVRSLVTGVLTGAGFDGVLSKMGFKSTDPPGGRTLSQLAGSLALIAIMVFAAVEAANMIGFSALGAVLTGLIEFGGQVLLGLVVFGVGLWLAGLAASTVRESGVAQADTLALASRVAILALTGAMALRQMGLGERIIELAFGLTLGAVAVAAAIAFGLGGREQAAEQIRRWQERA